jgi:hypothetical protein
MKRTIAVAFLAAAVNVALSSASAQTTVKANIPFDFRVGSTPMPAGDYKIKTTESGFVWIDKLDGSAHAVALAMTHSDDATPPAKLVFNRYGSQYFLRKTLKADGKDQSTFSQSKLEKSVRTEEASIQAEEKALIALK